MDAQATILGIPGIPTITEVNVRSEPSINSVKKFSVPVGMSGLELLRVKPDRDGTKTSGKLHNWIFLQFHGGATGWIRDDLIEIEGNCAKFGYTDNLPKTRPFDLTINPNTPDPGPADAQSAPLPAPTPAPAVPIEPSTSSPAPDEPSESTTTRFEASGKVRIRSAPSLQGIHLGWLEATAVIDVVPDSRTQADGYIWWQHANGWSAEKSTDDKRVFLQPPVVVGGPVVPITSREGFDDLSRIKLAAYAITGAFEGSGYAAYNNYDSGIISYGLIQFTLAAGSLITVVQRYLTNSQTDVANQIRNYLPRIEARDANLRHDENLKNLLTAAADEQVMKDAQHSVADEKYWDKVWTGYVEPRGLTTPLGIALLFDMGVNFGTGHRFVRLAENQLGVPPRSKPGQNGISEEQLIQKVAELRKASHDKQAKEEGFYGLMKRGNFWVRLVNQGDWGLLGDSNGNVKPSGKTIQVRNP